jgi:PBP1b-binding outer membrane lipoprotein LpoB
MKKIAVIAIVLFAVLLVFGCTQAPIDTQTTNNNNDANTPLTEEQVINEANSNEITDTNEIDIGNMIE